MENLVNFFFQKIKTDLSLLEFNTFLIGIVSGKEKNNDVEKPFKKELGKKISQFFKKEVNFKDPDVLILVDLKNKKINYQIKPLYIFGRYQKIKTGIPQTRWHKKIYQTSVQEEIGKFILKHTKGKDHSFHGCGREDIDVLMLGNGRPFVIEIKDPQIRTVDLKKIEKEINENSLYVKVFDLKFVNKEKILEVKLAKPDKIYQAEIEIEKPISKEVLENACQKLSGITINQQTPTRVLHRRYDLLRKRKIYYCKVINFHPKNPVLEIKSESGTYIKELVNGDNQRTVPSLSKLLGQKAEVKLLKVISVNF